MDNKTKKVIKEEWLREFPDLSAYAQNKLYKLIGSFVCGIELINLPRSEDYRPHFVIYPLYKKNVKSCLEYPELIFQFYDSKKRQIDLSYKDVGEKLKKAISIVLNDLEISLKGSVSLNSFYNLIDNVQKNEVIYNSHSGKSASLLELKFHSALYVGNQNHIQNILSQIEQSSKNWDMNMFETWYGKFDLWFKGLKEKVNNRDEFLKQIETNKQDKKIEKLCSSELVMQG